jgi:photosystem II stability/assembly factor-like uncharacterized protein
MDPIYPTQRRKWSWLAIAILALPALALFGYSFAHPGIKGKDDRLIPVVAAQKSAPPPASPWTMQESGTTAGLRGIYSVDGKIAWASGTVGTVLRTIDGGEHWQKCAVPDGDKDGATLDFRGVQAWDEKTAMVMASGPGEKSRLYRTDNAGQSWTLLAKNEDKDGFWDAVSWVPTEGRPQILILGDPVNSRFVFEDIQLDGSKLRSLAEKDSLQADANSGAFAASNSSFAYGAMTGKLVGILGTGGQSGAAIYRTNLPVTHSQGIASGTRWQRIPVPLAGANASSGVFSVKFGEGVNVVAVGGDYAKPVESLGTAAYSKDAGLHWIAAIKPPHGYRSSVAWSDELKAWVAAGTNGSDISRDDGKTWQPLDDGNWNALSLPFVVGPKGRIARLSLLGK